MIDRVTFEELEFSEQANAVIKETGVSEMMELYERLTAIQAAETAVRDSAIGYQSSVSSGVHGLRR